MNSRYRISVIALMGATMIMAASCAKDQEGVAGKENFLNFSSGIAEIVPVKSGVQSVIAPDSPARFVTLSCADGSKSVRMEMTVEPNITGSAESTTKALYTGTTINQFTVAGYSDSDVWFPKTNVDLNVSSTFDTYKWKYGDSHTFYAYANLDGTGMTASIDPSGVTLNCTDITTNGGDPLLGRYSGDGKDESGIFKGQASMTFYHPMTVVIFKLGTLDESITAINSISIDGVYASGSTSLAAGTGTPTFTWSASGTKEVSQAITTQPGSDEVIGDPFVLIPQHLAMKSVTVKMEVSTDDGPILLTQTLNSVDWRHGNINVYTVVSE